MKTIAIIPARGGSKRIPRKNIKDFLGKPIIAYSIETALESGLFSEVMVSTEDEEIAEVAKKYGAKVPFLRSADNADDFTGTVDVLVEVLEQYKKIGFVFEKSCCVYPTAPFVSVRRLEEAKELLEKKNYDCVFPMVRFSYPIQRALKMDKAGKIAMFEPENLNKRSQDLESAYHDAGQFYFFNVQSILQKQQLWTNNTGAIILPETEVQDIDNQEDWEIAQIKYQWLQSKQ
ncbi:MAG: pseudaminic acid cytidylyltransferase [Thermonemataceae bacterium]|nr:pseudaminic acid cytidylyltransferase [Thermonemataceae bacterium]